jgi:hypothetical protein
MTSADRAKRLAAAGLTFAVITRRLRRGTHPENLLKPPMNHAAAGRAGARKSPWRRSYKGLV